MYKVDIGSNQLWRRRADQIRESNLSMLPEPQPEAVQTQIVPNVQKEQPVVEPQIEISVLINVSTPKSSHVAQHTTNVKSKKRVEGERRYPLRMRKPPKRLEL